MNADIFGIPNDDDINDRIETIPRVIPCVATPTLPETQGHLVCLLGKEDHQRFTELTNIKGELGLEDCVCRVQDRLG